MVYPEVLTTSEILQVDICTYGNGSKVIETEIILDINQFREVIGLEILNLKLEAGKTCLNQIKENIKATVGSRRYSYDEDSDSFYLQLANESSVDQKAVIGTLTLNREGEIVALSAKLVD